MWAWLAAWQGLALGWGRTEHLPACSSLFPEGGEWGGALALPSPHPLGPHPNPPPEGHFSGSFSFPGRQGGGGKLPGWEEGLGADPGATGQPWRNGCSSSEVSADLMISPPPSLHAAERGGTLGPGGAFPGEGRDL